MEEAGSRKQRNKIMTAFEILSSETYEWKAKGKEEENRKCHKSKYLKTYVRLTDFG